MILVSKPEQSPDFFVLDSPMLAWQEDCQTGAYPCSLHCTEATGSTVGMFLSMWIGGESALIKEGLITWAGSPCTWSWDPGHIWADNHCWVCNKLRCPVWVWVSLCLWCDVFANPRRGSEAKGAGDTGFSSPYPAAHLSEKPLVAAVTVLSPKSCVCTFEKEKHANLFIN